MASATKTARANGGAPEKAPASASAPEPATAPPSAPEPASAPVPAFDLDKAIESDNGEKGKKVYREICARAPIDGGFATLAREQHIDGSEGEYLVKLIRVNDKEPSGSEKRESAQYVSAEKMKAAKAALSAIGVRMWKD